MKRSAQREAILSELRMLVTHPTAEELFVRLKAKMPHLTSHLQPVQRLGLLTWSFAER